MQNPKNRPVFFLFRSLLHFTAGATVYIGRALRARFARANFFEKRENATKTDGKISR